MIVPAAEAFGKFVQKFTPQATLEESRHKLELAGLAQKVKPAQFSGYRVVAAVVLGGASLMLLFVPTIPFFQRLLIIIVGFVLGYMLPSIWLGQKIKKRQDEITKALPDAMDLLTICVEAGLGFDAAMRKVADKWDADLIVVYHNHRRNINEAFSDNCARKIVKRANCSVLRLRNVLK